MGFFKQLLDVLALRSERPVLRLFMYYVALGVAIVGLCWFFPPVTRVFVGDRLASMVSAPLLLEDGLAASQVATATPLAGMMPLIEFALTILLVFAGTLALMLPVSWVYMSARKDRVHDQTVAQSLIILPLVVAGVVLVVQDSLALAFGLAGVVAAVRFRTTLSDTRDVVFIFLAIAVGFAAGVQVLTIGVLLSVVFNAVVVAIWRNDFGRSVLEPTAGSTWTDPLRDLATPDHVGVRVPDRDLVLALTPKKVDMLTERFKRVRDLIGKDGKNPRYNAVVCIATNVVSEAQQQVENVLEGHTKRWRLDEVVTNNGKASQLYYLIKTGKAVSRDSLLTAIRTSGNGAIQGADVEIGDALATENREIKEEKKKAAKA